MRLVTLGKFELSGSPLSRPKPLLLLSYLSLEGSKERRHLAELFYAATAQPMLSLRVALTHIREAYSEAFTQDESKLSVSLNHDAIELIKAHEENNVSRVIALYKGAFLDGLYIKDLSVELEEWILGTREYLAGLVRQAYLQQSETLATKGDFQNAVGFAEKAYGLAGAAALESKQLEFIYSLLQATKSTRAAVLKGEMQELGLALSPAPVATLLSDAVSKQVVVRHNLPVLKTSFVGRTLELAELSDFVLQPEYRLICLTGLGGMGKTRLSLELAWSQLANSLWQGIYFLALDALTDASAIPLQLAKVLGLSVQTQQDCVELLIDFINTDYYLLILDNYEHLIQDTQFISLLLAACPNVSFVVTSRERLNIAEEAVYGLQGLKLNAADSLHHAQEQEAIQLFVERAKRADLRFQLTEHNLRPLLNICDLLEGAPLALELCAAWVRMMNLEDIAVELKANLDFLLNSKQGVPQRHKSLRAAFEHSWRLLSLNEQKHLMRLAVFKGGFRREAAAEVCGTTLPVLAALLDKSLLKQAANSRFERHNLIYRFTSEKLSEDTAEKQLYEAQHARYFLKLAQAAEPQLRTSEQRSWLKTLELEKSNFDAALSWSLKHDVLLNLALLNSLGIFWYVKADFQEGLAWFEKALGQRTVDDESLYANALYNAARLARSVGYFAKAQRLLDEALELSLALLEKPLSMKCFNELGILAATQSQYELSRSLFEQSQMLALELENQEGLELPISNLGLLSSILGDFVLARDYLEQRLAFTEQKGDEHSRAHTLNNLGLVAQRQGQFDEALRCYEETYQLSETLNSNDLKAESLLGLAVTNQALGLLSKARAYLRQSLELYLELSKPPGIIDALAAVVGLALEQHNAVIALQLLAANHHFREQFNYPLRPFEKPGLLQSLAQCEKQLGSVLFNQTLEQDQSLTLKQASQVALNWLE